MKCPVCPDVTLAMMNRQGVEIDYCPQCRGVWLDRGELDKLIELAVGQSPARQTSAVQQRPDFVDSDGYGSRGLHGTNGAYGSHGYQPRRKKSWLNEIFD
ncbi:MAG: zf-TFIIB domain-containing protein [Polaromonas sp.]|nr:zf-TFIIB domain-containing protein [Polaromonas sp.]